MLKQLTFHEAEIFSKEFGVVKYVCNPFWLAFNGYIENRNGEKLFSERDETYPNDFPYIKVPAKEINLRNAIISWVTEDEFNSIQKKVKIVNSFFIGEEFYYKTENILDINGKDKKDFRRNVNAFKKKYNYKVFNDYSKKKIIAFIEKWAKNQKDKNEFFEISKEYALFCVENMNEFKHAKWIFLEIDGSVTEYNLDKNEMIKVDTGHIAMYEESVSYELTTVKGVKNVLFSGEGLFLATLKGPGKVMLQSMPIRNLANKLLRYMPRTSGGGGKLSGINLGNVFEHD